MLGIDLSLSRSQGLVSVQLRRHANQPKALPPELFEDPRKALFHMRGGKPAAFHCPIDRCVTVNGLNFAARGWHPFSAALLEYAGGWRDYSGSLLELFYAKWRPASAQEALIDPAVAPPQLKNLPPHLIYLFPWSARTIEEADRAVMKWTTDDHLEHQGPRLDTIAGGLKDQGPIAQAVGEFEYKRLTSIFSALGTHDFDRRRGDVAVLMLKRGEEYRFLNYGGGLHRTAAMRALGHSHVPARFLSSFILDIDDVAWWPQVQTGLWTESHARRYVDHLFDFDAYGWAAGLGLISSPVLNASTRMSLAFRPCSRRVDRLRPLAGQPTLDRLDE